MYTMRQVEGENKGSKTKVSLRKSKWRSEKMKTKKREASKTKKNKQKKQRERNEVWSPECSTSDYSNLAADINLNEVTSGVGGQPQHSHPGTPHPTLFPSLLSIKLPPYLISETPFEASEWVTSATPHAVGTNRGITEFGIAFWFGRVSGMGWWENRKKEGGGAGGYRAYLGTLTNTVGLIFPSGSRQIGTQRSRLPRSQCPQMTKHSVCTVCVCKSFIFIKSTIHLNVYIYHIWFGIKLQLRLLTRKTKAND